MRKPAIPIPSVWLGIFFMVIFLFLEIALGSNRDQ